MNLRVGLAAHRQITPETVASILGIDRTFRPVWQFQVGAYIHDARNTVAQTFLGNLDETHLFFLDADMVLGPAVVAALEKRLSRDPKIGAISAYYVRWRDGTPVHGWKEDGRWLNLEEVRQRSLTSSGVVEVNGFGAGCLLITRDALKAVDFPYFWGEYEPQGYVGEDVWFCRKLKAAGFHPSVDFDQPVGHVGPTNWEPEPRKPELKVVEN